MKSGNEATMAMAMKSHIHTSLVPRQTSSWLGNEAACTVGCDRHIDKQTDKIQNFKLSTYRTSWP